MQIRKVVLKDIKNYTEQTFDFETGVTAICGPNGAGKTTIIEAIAWTLFDHLDYKREDFARKGTRKGSVSVTFISKQDGREYSIFRDTSGTYYAYDVALQSRLAQQKQDVLKWLCMQHGVEQSTDLSILFRTTIGVPQGTFTFDFLQPPSKRKPVFDKILKVEDYIKASDELKDLLRLIDKRISTIREQIASDEGELKRYEEISIEHADAVARISELRRLVEEGRMDRQVAEVRVGQLDFAKNRIERVQTQLQSVDINFAQKHEKEKSLITEISRAERAVTLVDQAREGYTIHQSANKRLQQLTLARQERESHRTTFLNTQQEQSKLELNLKHNRELLAQIVKAREEIVLLEPKIERQKELEQSLRELQRKLGEKDQVERNLSKMGRELDELRAKYSEISKGVEEAEKHKDAAALVKCLEIEKQQCETDLLQISTKLTELKHKESQLNSIEINYKKCSDERDMLTSRVNNMRQEINFEGPAIEELENSLRNATNDAAEAKAIMERDERMSREIKNGLCPLLSQRCLNIKEGETLDSHFKFQLEHFRQQLETSEALASNLNIKLARARNAASKRSTFETLTAQLDKLNENFDQYRKDRIELRNEINSLGSTNELSAKQRTNSARVQELDRELSTARDGEIKYAQLEPRRIRLNELAEEGKQRRKVYDAEKARLTNLVKDLSAQAEIESDLVHLGNPRATAESLQREIAREGQLKIEQTNLEHSYQEVKQRLAKLDVEMAQWQGLDNEIAQVNQQLSETRNAYETFIAHQNIATHLPNLMSEKVGLQAELERIKQEQEKLQTELKTANANYSVDEHSKARSRLEELIRTTAQLESEFKYKESQENQLRAQLEVLEEVRKKQADKMAKRDSLGELHELADFIRECLRKAGPYITEAYLHTISIEANQLYREISGNSLVSLRWDPEYEIVLEEEGRDRAFNNLSGGEQMAAALSVRMALLKEFSELRFAFFDEPTTNMDEERRRNLAQQIGRIKDFEQLFIVSHDDSFEGFTDRIIQLGK